MRWNFWSINVLAMVTVCACGSPEQPSATAPATPSTTSSPVPETIVIDNSQGRITLPHLAHAKKFQCNTCHSEIIPGKIAWDKNTAHAYCRDCHLRNGKGPMNCTECHKK